MDRKIILTSLLTRLTIATLTRTVFQPDEYFQSLEPAFRFVFGYGNLTWEWLIEHPIRSAFYPALNVPIFWLLKFTGLASAGSLGDMLLIVGPRLLHGAFAAVTDVFLCELTRVTLGNDYISTALLLSLSSFFHALALSRSLSNSLETSLSTIAFTYYPWDVSSKLSPQLIYNKQRLRRTFIFSALACMVRPTNAVIWVFLYFKLVWSLRRYPRFISRVVLEGSIVGLGSMLTLFAFDSLYYQRLLFTPYNFLKTNLSSVSLFYGSNAWHYYLTQGIPILCTTALPFVLHGIYKAICQRSKTSDRALKNMLGVVGWSVIMYSAAGHKEWRFIHPILPLLHIFATKSLVDLSSATIQARISHSARSKIKQDRQHNWFNKLFPPLRQSHLILLLLTLPASVYVVLFYCSAPISVISYLQTLPINASFHSEGTLKEQHQSVGFLMPCHSTPGQAYLHRPTWEVWSLGCEPPLQGQNLSTYRDQTDIFFDSPLLYIAKTFPETLDASFPRSPYPASIPGTPPSDSAELYSWRHSWPRHLVFFGALLKRLGFRELVEEKGYVEVWSHGRNWEGEGERKGGVHVWSWRG